MQKESTRTIPQQDKQTLVYLGTEARELGEGIYVCRLDPVTGSLEALSSSGDAVSAFYLAFHPSRRRLYAASGESVGGWERPGLVYTYEIDQATGALRLLGQESSQGALPCHIDVDQTGRYALVANYMGGNAALLPIRPDGTLAPASDVVQHQGSSVNPERQEKPHPHSINLSPDNRFALVADLGLDRVFTYRLDLERGKLAPNTDPWAPTHPGAGPRHLAFGRDGRIVYVINELDSTVTAFSYDPARGVLRELAHQSTLPPGFRGTNTCADIHVAPSGRFVHGSNRGHDSIAIFAVAEADGRLTALGHAPTLGHIPWNFAIDPSGSFLLVTNRNSDNVVVFRFDAVAGWLSPTGHSIRVPKPVCVRFLSV